MVHYTLIRNAELSAVRDENTFNPAPENVTLLTAINYRRDLPAPCATAAKGRCDVTELFWMGWLSLFALAVALAMDAFAVAVAAAITLETITRRHLFRLSFHFGLFQAGMVLLGWLVGSAASRFLSRFDHWIAFGLLFFVGARMIWGALFGDPEGPMPDRTRGWDLVLLSVATSVDALAVGLSLALLQGSVFVPALVIGIVAAVLTAVGMGIGRKIGSIWGSRVEVLGGFILIFIGLKIVFDHVIRA